MIYGAKFWNDKDRYYRQDNNPSEETLRKDSIEDIREVEKLLRANGVAEYVIGLVKKELRGFLESCGPTAAVNCLAALDYNLKILCPGPYRPQPEETLMDFFNNPLNYDALEAIRQDVDPVSSPGNRIPQWYPYAVKEVFGATGVFVWISGYVKTISYLKHGWALQLCLVDPGHYIAAVAYDDESSEIIYNDPWPAGVGGNGFNQRLNIAEFDRNVKKFAIIYKEQKYAD